MRLVRGDRSHALAQRRPEETELHPAHDARCRREPDRAERHGRIRVSEAQSLRAQLDTEIARADLILRVTRSYIEAVAAQRRLSTTREQITVAAEGLRVARVRVRAGRASPLEESRAGVTLANAEGAAERAERSAMLASGNLSRLVGRPVQTLDTAWFERVGAIGPAVPLAADGTLAAAAAQADVRAAEAQVTLARSQRLAKKLKRGTLEVFPGEGHVFGPTAASRRQGLVTRFLRQPLGGPSSPPPPPARSTRP